jgi:hypothetical protein
MKGFFSFQTALICPETDLGPTIDKTEGATASKPSIYQTPTPYAPAEWPFAAVCFLLDSIKGV